MIADDVRRPSTDRPTTQELRVVASAIRQKAESEARAQMNADFLNRKKRGLMRKVYRRMYPGNPEPVDFKTVRLIIEDVAGTILNGWRKLSAMDQLAMADAGTREDFGEFEFLLNRSMYRLSGIKDIISQTNDLVKPTTQKGTMP